MADLFLPFAVYFLFAIPLGVILYIVFGINSVKHILVVFLVIPQFILGVILGYLRITYGFLYAVCFHTIVNLSLLF